MSDRAAFTTRPEATSHAESNMLTLIGDQPNMNAQRSSNGADTNALVGKGHLPSMNLVESGKHCAEGTTKLGDYKEPAKLHGSGKVFVPGPADKVTPDKLVKQIDGEANVKPRH